VKLGTYSLGKTLLYVFHSSVGSSLWSDKVVPSNRRLSLSPNGVKTWRTFSGESHPLLVVNKEKDKMILGIGGVCF
jgi:hypothetical protein